MSNTITADSLTPNEPLATRSRIFSPETVKRVHDLLTGVDGAEPVKNIGIGTFKSEGKARSSLVTLNRCLAKQYNVEAGYAGTVRELEDGQFRAVLQNKPAKVVERKPSSKRRAA